MSVEFMNALTTATNVAYTENGAKAFATTTSAVLDLFAQGGALRNCDDASIDRMLFLAYNEDALLATRAMFYFRDIRGGQGERTTFRKHLKWMVSNHPEVVRKNIKLIPEYGRWDDLYTLFDTDLEDDAIELFRHQLTLDVCSDRPSILAKWLKSENTSSTESRRLGRKTRVGLDMTPKNYRKTLSTLRTMINVVEQQVSANKWDEIDYQSIPSQANLKYARAFFRHDETRRREFLAALKKGEVKINAGVLYPYEIVRRAHTAVYESHERDLVNSLWDALPNYIGDTQENAIAVVDVSGSMSGLPMDVAISIGLYLAERNTCEAYHNKFITFSDKPQLLNIVGGNLCDRIQYMQRSDWEMNTDLHAVFRLILNTAISNNLTQDQIPHKLYIISDMEFDKATTEGGQGYNEEPLQPTVDETLFQTIAREYTDAGFVMPNLVFWNVDARNAQFPMSMDERGFQMVSGCSPSIFTNTMKGTFVSAHDLMIDVLNGERYQAVVV